MNHSPNQPATNEWPSRDQFKRSIRLEFSIYVGLVIMALMVVTGFVITDQYSDAIARQVIDKLLVQARSFSTAAGKHIVSSAKPDDLMLNTICSRFRSENTDVFWVGIAGKDSTFLAHTEIREVLAGRRMPSIRQIESFDLLRSGEEFLMHNDTISLAVPIRENDVVIGHLALGASAHQVTAARNRSILVVATITVAMLLVGVPIVLLIVNSKLRPISVITDQLRDVNLENLEIDPPVKTRDEVGYLAETLRFMGRQLREAHKSAVAHERHSRELEIAREIQHNILPRTYPSSESFSFAGSYTSAEVVGGDYFDFVEFDRDHLGFLVADVSGKSLPGMLVMLLTRDIIKDVSRSTNDPAEILVRVNSELQPNIRSGMFVTMAFGVLDRRTGEVTLASAGHNPTIWSHHDGREATKVKPNGFPLGLLPSEPFAKRMEAQTISLETGDSLVLFTDGINEARNAAQEEYGMERFLKTLNNVGSLAPSDLVAAVLKDHDRFVGDASQFDDITLVALRWGSSVAQTSGGDIVEGMNARAL